MHKVRSLLVLALASSVTAVALVVAAPETATGMPRSDVAPDCSVLVGPVLDDGISRSLSAVPPHCLPAPQGPTVMDAPERPTTMDISVFR